MTPVAIFRIRSLAAKRTSTGTMGCATSSMTRESFTLINNAFRDATGEQLLGDLTGDDLSGRGHSRTRTIASAEAGRRAIWFIVAECVTGLRARMPIASRIDFGLVDLRRLASAS